MIFARPLILYLIPLIAVLLGGLQIWSRWRKKKLLSRILATGRETQLSTINKKADLLQEFFLWLAIISLLIAAAGPATRSDLASVSGSGIDLIITLDISRSMNAGNPVSKLEIAKKAIQDLIEYRSEDRFALIVFSGGASILTPLTLDRRNLVNIINNLTTSYTSSQGTSILSSLIASQKIIQQRNDQRTQVILLFSDGEDFGPDYSDQLSYFQDQQIPIVCFGVGDPEGEPIPSVDYTGNFQGYLLTNNGDTALTYLDKQKLTNLAELTGGIYVDLKPETRINQEISGYLRKFKKQRIEESLSELMIYHYEIPLGIACLLIALSLITERMRRKKLWTF